MYIECLGVMTIQYFPELLLDIKLWNVLLLLLVLKRALLRSMLTTLLLIGLLAGPGVRRLCYIVEGACLIVVIIVGDAGLTRLIILAVRFRNRGTLNCPIINSLLPTI
jgi:hypothetical protein